MTTPARQMVKKEDVLKIVDAVITHANSRICNDGSELDFRQKIRVETASEIYAQILAIKP